MFKKNALRRILSLALTVMMFATSAIPSSAMGFDDLQTVIDMSYKRKYTADIELLQKANEELGGKLADVLENRSERNRWISHFTQYSDMEEIDRRIVVQLIKCIHVHGKEELHFEFNYKDEYAKALSLAMQAQERKAG